MSSKAIRVFLLGMLLIAGLFAQRDLGTLAGTVTDAQGAAIPNAKVTITEDATGLVYVVESNSQGEFLRPALKPGIYTITAELKGFRRVSQKNVVITGGDRIAIPLTLPVGDVSESVQVSAEAPLLQTESTTLGATVNEKAMSELPLGGQRTFTFLARLSPGVVPAENGARDAVGGGFSANGVRSNGQNNFLLNGVDNNVNVIDFLNQTSYVVGPSVEAIGEMRVLTNGYNAEYGRGAGGVVNVNLKSGSNQIHGAVFEILQNDKLNANRWENNKAGTGANGQPVSPRGPFKQNQFGAAAGGPIIKNKLFIFGDYQGTRIASSGGAVQNIGYGGFLTIPTQAMVKGDFSSLLGPVVNGFATNQIFDPKSQSGTGANLTRTPFPNNIIPASRFDPAAAKLLALYPATNQPLVNGKYPQNDYFYQTPGKQVTDQGDVRVDYRLSDKDNIFGTLSWSNLDKTNTPPFSGLLDASPFNGASEVDLGRNANLSYTRVWTNAIVSETRVGFSRLKTSRVGGNPNTDAFSALGIGGYNPTTTNNGGLPQFGLGRYSQVGSNDWLPSTEFSNVLDFIQNVAVNKGSHGMKFGAEYRIIKFPFFQVPYPHGEMNFSLNETAFPSQPANATTGDEIASLLLGQVNNGRISTTNYISSDKKAWAFYAQDDWKISRNLTLNIGVRYELFSPIGERFGRQSNFVYDSLTLFIPSGKDQNAPLPPNFATDFANVKVSRGQVDKYLIPWDKTNFAPRIGLAYNWKQKTVFRIGYGMFYGGEENQGGNPNRGESVPFNQSPDLSKPAGVGLFDPNPFFPGGVAGGYPLNVFSLNAPVSFREIYPNFHNGLVHKWNVAIQHELPGQMSLEVAYVGNHQANQLFQPDPNACPNTPFTTLSCATLRPIPNIGSVSGTASFGFGNYEGMTVNLVKRLSAGLQFTAAYTYGHALANTGTTLSGSTGFNILDPRNYSSSYSSAAWDIRHSFVSSFVYEVPFGRGKKYGGSMNRALDLVAGGWQMNGLLSLRTGLPFTLRANGCNGVWNTCMPVLIGKDANAAPSTGRSPDNWFDTTAVALPSTYGLANGNLGLQTNYGPPTAVLDASMFKGFRLTERFLVQFRAEGFNVANTPQFSVPDNNKQDTLFGKVTSTQSGTERKFQFSLRLQF